MPLMVFDEDLDDRGTTAKIDICDILPKQVTSLSAGEEPTNSEEKTSIAPPFVPVDGSTLQTVVQESHL